MAQKGSRVWATLWLFAAAVGLFVGAGPAPEAARPAAALAVSPPSPELDFKHYGGELYREIVRQAFLMAAREEMGLTVRDELLGDVPDPAAPALEIEATFVTGREKVVHIRRRTSVGKADVWKKTYEVNERLIGRSEWAAIMEAEARTTFPGVLKKAGFVPGTRAPERPDAVVPESTARRLDEMSIASQFAALRELHALLNVSRSPAIEGALVRAYANLSLLTEHQASPAYNVFKARALLYSERLVAAAPQSAWGLWHRAYAHCLGGMHRATERDLDEAEARLKKWPKATGAGLSKPDWLPLIVASSRFDPVPLFNGAKDPHLGELALLLRFIALENPQATQLALRAGRDVLGVRPESFRVLDGMAVVGGVGDQRESTELALTTSGTGLRKGLKAMSDVPEAIKALLDRDEDDDAPLLDALRGGDGGEPSWATYAHLYREERFAEAHRRLYFMRNALGVPTDEFLEAILPEFETHPYRAYLLLFSDQKEVVRTALPELVAAMNERVLQLNSSNHMRMVHEIMRYDPGERRKLYQWVLRGEDPVYRDAFLQMHIMSPLNPKTSVGGVVTGISPHAPTGIVEDIDKMKDTPDDRLSAKRWEKEFVAQPAVLAALGRRYAVWRDWENSKRMYKAAIALSPDSRTFQELADTYRNAGDLDGWKRTLDDYLAQEPDGGLGHAQARVKLAQYFMGRGEWKTAQPYAEAAAKSYARWAMQVAAECYEGMNDWEHAEVWVAREAERYNTAFSWYVWCLRTGHGHMKQAREAIWARIQQNQEGLYVVASVLELDGRKRDAFDFYQREYAARGVAGEGLSLVALADDLGEDAARDQVLAAMVARADPPGKPATQAGRRAQFCALLQAAIAKGDKASFDQEEFDRLVQSSEPALAIGFLYYGGRFVEKRGDTDKAIALYKRSLEASKGIYGVLSTTESILALRRLKQLPAALDNPAAKPAAESKPAAKKKPAKTLQRLERKPS